MHSKLSPREVAICERLHEVRLKRQISTRLFAVTLQISAGRLGSYEYKRAPLRYWLAKRLGVAWGVSLRWLATGQGSTDGFEGHHPRFPKEIDENRLLSEVYDNDILHFQDARRMRLAHQMFTNIAIRIPGGKDRAERLLVEECVKKSFSEIPPLLRLVCADKIERLLGRFFRKHHADIEQFRQEMQKAAVIMKDKSLIESNVNNVIDNQNAIEDAASVRYDEDPIGKLIEYLHEAVRRGTKQSVVARELRVSRQAVNNWLRGAALPSTASALRLQAWLARGGATIKPSQ